MKVRTRMAPSPTGEYHIGHIRTVLYNVALSRQNKGKFIIRIEDTDRTRFVEGATDRILDVIKSYGLGWDEGPHIGGKFGPYVQSERLEIYKKYALELITKGSAYYCFCSEDRLTAMREEQKQKGVASTKYDRTCLHLAPDEIKKNLDSGRPFVIRLKVPREKTITFDDAVYGKISIKGNEIDDQVLLKSDGFPTYHLGVVVDDHLMEITHVMRGNDWLPSTPKHMILYEAFGWDMPVHIHLPNLKELGENKKLSKRYGAVFAREFIDEGYLPDAVLNFLMFLGWNPGGDKEIYTLEEFIKDFDIKKIHKTDLVAFDRKKLDWFNGFYIRNTSDSDLAQLLVKFAPVNADIKLIEKIVPLIKDRIKKLSEFTSIAGFFFNMPKLDKSLFGKNYVEHVTQAIKGISEDKDLMEVVTANSFKTGDFFMDLRIAISGNKITPPFNESIALLGKKETVKRLQNALE